MRGGVETQRCGAWHLNGEHRFFLLHKKPALTARRHCRKAEQSRCKSLMLQLDRRGCGGAIR
jgi:hypothetical protein